MKLVAITGGIGSGKSIVATMLQVMGHKVYDCDSRARALMTESDEVRHKLVEAFGKETFLDDGSLNRQHLSAVAFGNDEALARLNAIVHPATADDMLQWARQRASLGDRVAFVETALLRTARLDCLVDQVWPVSYTHLQVMIPEFGHINSLNVSVAGGIMIYEVVRQRLNDNQDIN